MYWGNPGIPCTDSEKMDVLYDELKHCQDISMGPNFVVSFFNNIRDLFHDYLNKCEFHFSRLRVNKINNFCFLLNNGRVLGMTK